MKDILAKIWRYFVDKAQGELIVSLLVMFVVAIIAIILGIAIKKADYKKPTKGMAFVAETIVNLADSQVNDILGTAYGKFTPVLVFMYLYIPLAFIAGLFGFASPITYYTIPLCLALISWFGIQLSAIHYQKIEYLKGFTSPLPTYIPVFVPINILSKISPLLSLSIRMFGNAVAGYILMWLVYWGTGMLSEAVLNLADWNVFGMIIAPWLHAYFDIFGAFIQTLIFTTLTMLLIASEIPAPVNVDPEKLRRKIAQNEKKTGVNKNRITHVLIK